MEVHLHVNGLEAQGNLSSVLKYTTWSRTVFTWSSFLFIKSTFTATTVSFGYKPTRKQSWEIRLKEGGGENGQTS